MQEVDDETRRSAVPYVLESTRQLEVYATSRWKIENATIRSMIGKCDR